MSNLQNQNIPEYLAHKVIPFHLAGRRKTQIQILTILERLRYLYSESPLVREFAIEVLGFLDNNDKEEQINILTQYVKDRMVYISDPLTVEYVISPVTHIQNILKKGFTHGDCDDHALFLNSMLGSIGIKTMLVGVKLRSEKFNHVISSVWLDGEYIDIDPCAKKRPQREYDERLIVKI